MEKIFLIPFIGILIGLALAARDEGDYLAFALSILVVVLMLAIIVV